MTKPKTKLVCVGWGIWDIVQRCFWRREFWDKRREAVEEWNCRHGENSYQWSRQCGEVIAEKLWIEMRED